MSAGEEHLDLQQFNIILNFIFLHNSVKCGIFYSLRRSATQEIEVL